MRRKIRRAGQTFWRSETVTDGVPSRAIWRDLGPRMLSAIVMVAVGVTAIALGHAAFTTLVLAAAAVGVWEFYSMARFKQTHSSLEQSDLIALSLYFALFVCGILGLIGISHSAGRLGVLYIVSLVVITDTLGYFVGRRFGGAKFWPSISPKKTWSGIVGGWAGAFALSLGVGLATSHTPLLGFIIASVLLSFASQLGDIAQSAVKRRMGVKDSSNLIPGHGGVLDRFDALLAIGACFLLIKFFFLNVAV